MIAYVLLAAVLIYIDLISVSIRNGMITVLPRQVWISGLLLLLFFGFRKEVGTDWLAYQSEFLGYIKYRPEWSEQYFEPGFYLLQKIAAHLSHSFYVFISFLVALNLFFLRRMTKEFWVSQIFLFGMSTGFFPWGLSGMRQFLSVLIVMYFFMKMNDLSTFWKMVLLLIAISIHYSSIIVAVALAALKLKLFNSRSSRFLVLILALFLGFSTIPEDAFTILFSAEEMEVLDVGFQNITLGTGFLFKLLSYSLLILYPLRTGTHVDNLRYLFFLGSIIELFLLRNTILARSVLALTGLEFVLLLYVNNDLIKCKNIPALIVLNMFIFARFLGLLERGVSDITPFNSILF